MTDQDKIHFLESSVNALTEECKKRETILKQVVKMLGKDFTSPENVPLQVAEFVVSDAL